MPSFFSQNKAVARPQGAFASAVATMLSSSEIGQTVGQFVRLLSDMNEKLTTLERKLDAQSQLLLSLTSEDKTYG